MGWRAECSMGITMKGARKALMGVVASGAGTPRGSPVGDR